MFTTRLAPCQVPRRSLTISRASFPPPAGPLSTRPEPPAQSPLHCRPLLPLPSPLHSLPSRLPARVVLSALSLASLTLEASEHHRWRGPRRPSTQALDPSEEASEGRDDGTLPRKGLLHPRGRATAPSGGQWGAGQVASPWVAWEQRLLGELWRSEAVGAWELAGLRYEPPPCLGLCAPLGPTVTCPSLHSLLVIG